MALQVKLLFSRHKDLNANPRMHMKSWAWHHVSVIQGQKVRES